MRVKTADMAAYKRAWDKARKDSGRCKCGRELLPGFRNCVDCRMKRSGQQKKWFIRRVRDGKCGRCGRKLDGVYANWCVRCIRKRRIAERCRTGSRPWRVGGPGRPPKEWWEMVT